MSAGSICGSAGFASVGCGDKVVLDVGVAGCDVDVVDGSAGGGVDSWVAVGSAWCQEPTPWGRLVTMSTMAMAIALRAMTSLHPGRRSSAFRLTAPEAEEPQAEEPQAEEA